MTYVGHATTLVRLDGTAALTDPAVGRWIGPLRRQRPPPTSESLEADVVVISHLHRDHLDLRSLRSLRAGTHVIVPPGAGSLAADACAAKILELPIGQQASIGALTITAVPARHDPRRGPWGMSAEPQGYVFSSSRRRVYFAGDTELFPEMSSLRPLDLALLPVWGWGPSLGRGHLSPASAARALTLLRPDLAVPIHWGTFYPVGLARLIPGPLSQPPVDFARLAGKLAPDVRVRILQPGSGLVLDREQGS